MHNITSFPVTERPGTESYDPVLLGGKSVRSNASLAFPRRPLFHERCCVVSRPAEPLCSRTSACVYVQLVDHYSYAAIAPKEVLVNPLSMQ